MASKSHIIMSVNNSIPPPQNCKILEEWPPFFVIRLNEFCSAQCARLHALYTPNHWGEQKGAQTTAFIQMTWGWRLLAFPPFAYFYFFFAMCTNSTHALCIGCTQRLPHCIMLTPQAGWGGGWGRQFIRTGERKKKSYLKYDWNLRASYLNLSIYLRLTHTVAILLNFDLPWQVTAAGNGRGTTGPPQFLNHSCQIVKTSGSAGMWCRWECVSFVIVVLGGGTTYEW